MAKPPELVAFLLANTGLFLISSVLTGLAYLAYRRNDGSTSFRWATLGFGCVVLGGLVEPVYLFVTPGDTYLHSSELLALQAGEGILIAIGLGLLFYAILNHDGESASPSAGPLTADEIASETDDWGFND